LLILFTDTEVLKYISKHFMWGNLPTCYISELMKTDA